MARNIPDPIASYAAGALPEEVQKIIAHYTSIAEAADKKPGVTTTSQINWSDLARAAVAYNRNPTPATIERLTMTKEAIERSAPPHFDKRLIARFTGEVIDAAEARASAPGRS